MTDWFQEMIANLISQFVLPNEQQQAQEYANNILAVCKHAWSAKYFVDLTALYKRADLDKNKLIDLLKYNYSNLDRHNPKNRPLIDSIKRANQLNQISFNHFLNFIAEECFTFSLLSQHRFDPETLLEGTKNYILRKFIELRSEVFQRSYNVDPFPLSPLQIQSILDEIEKILLKQLEYIKANETALSLDTRFCVVSKLLDLLITVYYLPEKNLANFSLAVWCLEITSTCNFYENLRGLQAKEMTLTQNFCRGFPLLLAKSIQPLISKSEIEDNDYKELARQLVQETKPHEEADILEENLYIVLPEILSLLKQKLEQKIIVNCEEAVQQIQCIDMILGGSTQDSNFYEKYSQFLEIELHEKYKWPAEYFAKYFLGLMIIFIKQDENFLRLSTKDFVRAHLGNINKKWSSAQGLLQLEAEVWHLINADTNVNLARTARFFSKTMSAKASESLYNETVKESEPLVHQEFLAIIREYFNNPPATRLATSFFSSKISDPNNQLSQNRAPLTLV